VEKSEVVDALHFLRNIGDVAYFDDDPSDGLADRVFLVKPFPSCSHALDLSFLLHCGAVCCVPQDPQWLTNVMSSVVTLRHNIVRSVCSLVGLGFFA